LGPVPGVSNNSPKAAEEYKKNMDYNPKGRPWDPNILEVLVEGVPVTVVSYGPGEPMELREKWNVGKHLEESNEMKYTSIYCCINVVDKEVARSNNDWALALKSLLAFYGEGRSVTVKRWARRFFVCYFSRPLLHRAFGVALRRPCRKPNLYVYYTTII